VLYISPLDRKDTDAGFVVVLQDITEFKAARQQALAEKARAQTYLDVVDVMILVLDTAGNVKMINKKGCELLERSAEQIQGIDWFNVCLPPSYRQISRNAFQRIVDGGEKSVAYLENPIQTARGVEKLIAWRHTALRDASGKIVGVVSSGLDITESRDAEEARRISEQRLRVALSAAQMGTWRWEAATGLLSRDANLNEMLGLPAEEITERVDDFFNYVHLDDQVAAKTEFERSVLERDTFLSRFRIIRSDGSVRSVLDQGKPFYDFNGQLEYVTGVVVDITEQTEYQLRYQNIINSAPMGILTYELDADDRLVLTGSNQAANTILGVSFSVSIGKTIEEVFPELAETELPKEYRRICKNGGIYHGDNFEYRDARVGGFYEFDAFQTSPGTVAVAFTDVTERMRTQTQLRFTHFAVDHAGEAAYWMGPDAKFIYVNEKACDSMGYTQDEMMLMSVPDIDPDFPREAWGDHWKKMRQKGVDRFESHHKTKDGTVFPVEVTSNFVTFENQEYICAFARDITVRKRAEKGLKKSEKRNRAWLENSPVCTKILDLDFNLQYMSQAGIVGLHIEDITEFYGKPYPFHFYPELFRNTMTKNLEKARETGGIIEQEAPVVDLEGKELWFHSTIVPVNDDEGRIEYIMVVSADITERKNAEHQREELMRQLQFTQFAFDNAGEAAHWVDFDEKFIYVNDMDCEELGYTREELMQMKVCDIDPFYPREDWEKHWGEMRETGVKRFEGRHVRKDGTIFPVEITSKFVSNEGIEYICSFERDITELKIAEQKRQVLARQLQNRNDELQSIVFAAAHDLRTPLVNIDGFTGELEKSLASLTEMLDGVSMGADVAERIDFLLKTDVPESLRFIKFGNQQMDMLLSGLMRLSRVGTTSVKETALDMYHLFDSVVQGFQYQINTLDIDLTIEEDVPDCIGDYSLMSQVFINLLDNAIKYRHPDRKGVIKLGGSVQDEMVEYSISDNGIGIELDQQDKVFDLFHQLHSKPDAKGQGLGLTIVRRIMDRQQGSVEIKSTPQEGTTIYVRLPKA
jgi:PAS domain S-box-containing protein